MKTEFQQYMDKMCVSEPTVAISGGIDSTVVLHHVCKYHHNVRTVTVSFGNKYDEDDKAARAAKRYDTQHMRVTISKDRYLEELPNILKHFPFPRYNVWPWFLVEALYTKDLFIGEGGDELFGYNDRTYLEGWAGQIVWVYPTWEIPCKKMGVKLHAPIKDYPAGAEWFHPTKATLRKMYEGILPDFVLKQEAHPPSTAFYEMMGESMEDLQAIAAKAWLEGHGY